MSGAVQSDILTVTLNPALDLATHVAQVIPGPKLRCAMPRVDPGGGGVNVARAVIKLGGVATALVASGGAIGGQLTALLTAEGVPCVPVPVSGETRQSFAVTDDSTKAQYRFSVPGQPLAPQDADNLDAAIREHAPKDGFVVFSGSVAPGLPQDFLRRNIDGLSVQSTRVIVDTSGAGLKELIADPVTPLYLLRVDHGEAAEAAGRALTTRADTIGFAAEIVGRGVAQTVVTGRGSEGSVLVSRDQRLFCRAPMVDVKSKIGAGDAFVGAMTLSLARGDTPEVALRWGVAAASATVGTEGTALCDISTARSCFAGTAIETV